MDNVFLFISLSVMNWLHLITTVVWIGGIGTNLLILMPSMRESLEPPMMGKLMGAVMKRFRSLVYASIVVLGVTGILMNFLNENYLGLLRFGNLWSQIALIKHIFTAALIFLAVYAFEGLGPKSLQTCCKRPFTGTSSSSKVADQACHHRFNHGHYNPPLDRYSNSYFIESLVCSSILRTSPLPYYNIQYFIYNSLIQRHLRVIL